MANQKSLLVRQYLQMSKANQSPEANIETARQGLKKSHDSSIVFPFYRKN